MELSYYVLLGLIVLIVILQFVFKPRGIQSSDITDKIDIISASVTRLENNLKSEFKNNREETAKIAKENREELSNTLSNFKTEFAQTLNSITQQNQAAMELVNKTLYEKMEGFTKKMDENNGANRESLYVGFKDFSYELRTKFDDLKQEQKELTAKTEEQLEKITAKVEEKLGTLMTIAKAENETMRDTVQHTLTGFQTSFEKNVESLSALQKEKFQHMEEKQNRLVDGTEKKLDEIRETVDEKLQKTLNDRLGHSFDLVGRQLESVQKGLGEMQTLAQDVGGLKKVLSNVKMRGGIGEMQLSMLLEQILAPEQYAAQVITKRGSEEPVEFAIKLPGRDDQGTVWLPIGAKFPKEVYEELQTAYEAGDQFKIEIAQKMLEMAIKKMAGDIHDKYIEPPFTTDFGIMFLPFESIYGEVVRKASLLDDLQRNYKIIITGPTTLAAILNSLQMGFKTLAIQQRSSEVWKVLSAVKQEFELFGGLMEKAQNNIQTGLNQLDDVIGKRTRAIQRRLRNVDTLGTPDRINVLSETAGEDLAEDEA